MPSSADLAQRLKAKALALGFQAVGILPGDVVLDGQALDDWLARSFHADMAWMTRNRDLRLQPGLLMPGTRSIVCVAMVYKPPGVPDNLPGPLKVARYAHGEDYHRVVKDRLKSLLADLQTVVPGARGRVFTDSAPILERALAVRAGLGWQGKHGNVIHPQLGSWFFIGELLVDVELQPDEAAPVPNLCGRCTRCIDICPTDAIPEPTVVDANLCLAYWTIESKADAFPPEIAEHQEGWIFGCDLCQEVCPWNLRFSVDSKEPAFASRPEALNPPPESWLALCATDDGSPGSAFRAYFVGSPLLRAGGAGLHRNLSAAMQAEPRV